MPRRQANRKREQGFIWIPDDRDTASDITIDGTSVFHTYISAEFTRAISPEIGHFKINLINADGAFSNVYTGGEEVILTVDKTSGTTQRFKGRIDSIKNKRGAYEVLEVSGGHISSELLDLTVTKEYKGDKSCDEILKDITDTYLTGYTYTNVTASLVLPNIKWSNKPFWSCVEDLCRLAVQTADVSVALKRFDCYVDDDKDFHFFEENSIENNAEAIVWNDTLITLPDLGEKQTLVKNKIKVYGSDDAGLPILRETSKTATPWLKEQIITDTDINTEAIAEDIATASLNLQQVEDSGAANCFILPSIQPGEKIWVSDPTMKYTKQLKINKYTHKYPLERTSVMLVKDRNISTILRDQMLKDIAQDDLINPFEMTKSLNFPFDDTSKIANKDDNVAVKESTLLLESGVSGTATTNIFIQTNEITQVHLLAVGEDLTNTRYKISTEGGDNLVEISRDQLSNVSPGKDIVLKFFLDSAEARIDSVALLIK